MKYLLICFLIFVSEVCSVFGQTTTIHGYLPLCAGEKVVLKTYHDLISFEEITIDTDIIEKDGFFDFNVDTNIVIKVIIEVAFYRDAFFIEPGTRYNLRSENFSINEDINPHLNGSGTGLTASLDSTVCVNSIIKRLNVDFNQFIDTSFVKIYKLHNYSPIQYFRSYLDNTYSRYNDLLITSAIKYRLASIEMSSGLLSRAEIFSKYIGSVPLYTNYEYMALWNEFFDHYLTSVHCRLNTRDLLAVVNKVGTLSAFSDTLSKDVYFASDEMRNLIMLKALGEFFKKPGFSEANLTAMLGEAANSSGFREQRPIAAAILRKCLYLHTGSPAPALDLPDIAGRQINLKNYSGKLVYIAFLKSGCVNCMINLESLREVYKQFQDKLEVVAIITDRDSLKAADLAAGMSYPWVTVIASRNYELLEAYRVYGYPLEVLIDERGNILNYPARRVEEGLFPLLSKKSGIKPVRPKFQPNRRN